MMNKCKLCGAEMVEGEVTCPICGYENVALVDDFEEDEKHKKSRKAKKDRKKVSRRGRRKKPLIAILILVVLGVGSYFTYNTITSKMEEKKRVEKEEELKASAQKVINLIDSIEDQDENTLEDLLKDIQKEYHGLTKEQKEYVTNYDKYQEAYDKYIANDLDERIKDVEIDDVDDTRKLIEDLREEYNNMTDSQKQKVKYIDYLDTYEDAVNEKEQIELEEAEKLRKKQEAEAAEAQKAENLTKLIKTFPEFSGKWGDFGAHINSNQGMIETAIKNAINLSDYFQGAPNDLTMWADSFTWTYGDVYSAWAYVDFYGTLKNGEEGWLSGQIVVNNNGELVYTEIYTSEEFTQYYN